jgi:hypothetical protein
MGFFKKLFKGVKKVFKRIGKRIKKIVKGIGKFMNKIWHCWTDCFKLFTSRNR